MLADSKVPFSVLLETTADGLLVCDQAGTLVLVNAEAERMFGYDAGELVGKSIDALLPDAVRSRHHRHMESYTAAPRIRLLGQTASALHARRRDGSEFPVEISLSPFHHAEHGFLVIGGVRDISERKRLEGDLRSARNVAVAASAAKSEFLSSMSHELRTPLNAILGFAQLLADDPDRPLDARQHERLGHVLRGGEHLLRLIDDVLDFSRIEEGRISLTLETVRIADVLDAASRTLESMAQRAQIRILLAPVLEPMPDVVADRTRLLQILMNFGSNAIKYGRPHGHVTLRTEILPDALRVAVEDDGIGIAERDHDRVFEPFQRAGQETGPIEGTGIGLTISRRLAKLMQATIDFTSQPGKGSTFWIDLPIQRAASALAEPQPFRISASPLAVGPPRYLVLYVEDNPSSVAFMRHLVDALVSIELITAPSAELGLELARTRRPKLVLMDINLPGVDGFAATEELRRSPDTRDIPVVGLSAAALADDVARARQAGFDRYLTKPVQLAALTRALEELLLG